ncbi:MAG: peptidase S24 [Candidatus Marinimicrobia bacterium]|nr:peptidase S24 [Candidatus Neomarinimicrobiota bacterium]
MDRNKIYKASNQSKLSINLYSSSIEAGFPSPADDHLDISLDLNKYLIKHPASTFYIYVKGDSMIDEGIHCGDIMIVDRSLEAKSNDIIVAVINGEFTVKKLFKKKDKLFLIPANKKYGLISITDEMDFQIWGIVTHTIHHCR